MMRGHGGDIDDRPRKSNQRTTLRETRADHAEFRDKNVKIANENLTRRIYRDRFGLPYDVLYLFILSSRRLPTTF
jgi:hypothetical protein